jgi:hypothetical protein
LTHGDYKFFYDRLGHTAFFGLVNKAGLSSMDGKGTGLEKEGNLAKFLKDYPEVADRSDPFIGYVKGKYVFTRKFKDLHPSMDLNQASAVGSSKFEYGLFDMNLFIFLTISIGKDKEGANEATGDTNESTDNNNPNKTSTPANRGTTPQTNTGTTPSTNTGTTPPTNTDTTPSTNTGTTPPTNTGTEPSANTDQQLLSVGKGQPCGGKRLKKVVNKTTSQKQVDANTLQLPEEEEKLNTELPDTNKSLVKNMGHTT